MGVKGVRYSTQLI